MLADGADSWEHLGPRDIHKINHLLFISLLTVRFAVFLSRIPQFYAHNQKKKKREEKQL